VSPRPENALKGPFLTLDAMKGPFSTRPSAPANHESADSIVECLERASGQAADLAPKSSVSMPK
jgi:hypothetical protein